MCGLEQNLPLLMRGLRRVKEKTNAEWEPEHIIEMCRSDKAFLFVVDEGFFILRPHVNPYTGQRCIKCEAAYSNHPAADESLILKYMPLVEKLGREIGATRLLFDSPRKGFERIPGVEISTVTYQKEICCG